MAIAATCVWEINSAADASNAGGGFWNTAATGVDWSQGLSPHWILTGGTAAGAGSTITHASAHADMVGNGLHILSGSNATVSWYEIISVVGTVITLDRAVTTGVSANIAFNIGGALAMDLSGAANQSSLLNAKAGNKIYIKSGSYPAFLNGNINSLSVGTAILMISVEGYAVTRGDLPKGSTRPIIAGTGGWIGTDHWNYTSLQFQTTSAGGSAFAPSGSRTRATYCKFTNTSTNTSSCGVIIQSTHHMFHNCEFICPYGSGLKIASSNMGIQVTGCYFHDCDMGIFFSTNIANGYPGQYVNNIFENCKTYAFRVSGTCDTLQYIYGNTFYGAENKLGTAISTVTAAYYLGIIGNIFYGFVKGIDVTDASAAAISTSYYERCNNYYNITTDVTNIVKGAADIALDPGFTGVAQLTGTAGVVSFSTLTVTSSTGIIPNQDYVYIISGTGATAGLYQITGVAGNILSLASAPGGSGTNIVYQITTGHNFTPGVNMKGVGQLGVFPGALSTGYQDMGAVQRQEFTSTGAGAANIRSGTTETIQGVLVTGTAVIPTAANVRSGTAVDATTGTLSVPAASNVRLGTAVDATTGTAAIPTAANTRSGVAVDATTGTLVVPTLANTAIGIAGDGGTGTFDGSSRWTSPGAGDLRYGVQLKSNSTSLNLTGTLDQPAEIASAVWDKATSGHTTPGTFGSLIQKLLTVAKFLGLK